MRFPWLQIDSDVIEAKAGDLAVLLGLSRRETLGLLVDLWAWCLTRSPKDAPPEGIISGSAPVPLVNRAASWTGPEQQLVGALLETGFVEEVPGGLRFRGIGRYASTWTKNRRRSGTGAEPERNRSGTGGDLFRKTQTQTQTQTQIEDTDLSPQGGGREQAALDLPGAEPAPKPGKPPKPPKAPKPPPEPRGDPRHKPLVAELVAVFKAKTGTAYGFQGVDARKVTDLLALADQDPETCEGRAPAEIARRWGIGLDWAWPSGERPVQSLTALVQRWNECRELRGPGGPKRFVDASTANHPKEAGDVVL